MSEAATEGVPLEKVFVKILEILQKNTFSLFNKVADF